MPGSSRHPPCSRRGALCLCCPLDPGTSPGWRMGFVRL